MSKFNMQLITYWGCAVARSCLLLRCNLGRHSFAGGNPGVQSSSLQDSPQALGCSRLMAYSHSCTAAKCVGHWSKQTWLPSLTHAPRSRVSWVQPPSQPPLRIMASAGAGYGGCTPPLMTMFVCSGCARYMYNMYLYVYVSEKELLQPESHNSWCYLVALV